jgi:hypothetical protein
MKTNEAKKIISTIIRWQLVLQGVLERNEVKAEVDLSKYTLEELLKANHLVESNNSRKRKLQDYWRELIAIIGDKGVGCVNVNFNQ